MSFATAAGERFDRYFYFRAPADRLALLRLFIGTFALCYLAVRFVNFTSVVHFPASDFVPVGPVALLGAPLSAWLVRALAAAAFLLGAAFVTGFRYRVTGPAFALALLWVTSYRNSWGMKFHTDNLLVVHVFLLGFAPAADALSIDARGKPEPAPDGKYGWAIRSACLVTVCTYVLAGLAKLRISGLEWATGEVLRTHIAYDNLRKLELGTVHSPIGAQLVRMPALFPPLASAALVLELGAPLALLHTKIARVWVVGVWLFHLGVLALMAIGFPYPLFGFAFLPFFEIDKLRYSKRAPRWLQKA
jgi:hypothetical protein